MSPLNSQSSRRKPTSLTPMESQSNIADDQNTPSPAAAKRPSSNLGETGVPTSGFTSHLTVVPAQQAFSPRSTLSTTVAATNATIDHHQPAASSQVARRRQDPPVAPPRTSSQYVNTAASSSKRSLRAEDRASNASRSRESRSLPSGSDDLASPSRGRPTRSTRDMLRRGDGGWGDESPTPKPKPTVPQHLSGNGKRLTREASEVLQGVVVCPSEDNAQREAGRKLLEGQEVDQKSGVHTPQDRIIDTLERKRLANVDFHGYDSEATIRANADVKLESLESKRKREEEEYQLELAIHGKPDFIIEALERRRLERAMGHERNVPPSGNPGPIIGRPETNGAPTATEGDTLNVRRSRHDQLSLQNDKDQVSKFCDYYLGNTIGEGEFGKVKLGWKQDGGVQVAIKLIRRDSVGNNQQRLGKIYREISILRGVSHPNIVRLHEMAETERHIGIVLEYASGGELFDFILNHRYLNDAAARRLFAQLVSGVGYLHKKGIVHRDLKLENLLLDRNRNIIITDFGFANTFDPEDELTEEEELNLTDRDFVKRNGLYRIKANGQRKGDLMQTSCGSPCYAAPELVVSDSLYTGRKVDVWSCGVILYAMLAGYLPYDDDPANPEGDNINLLYKYIVNTPLTFPEYVTPHARDLLRRILVPSPRKRADLFEVARHSWLCEYADVVALITSATTSPMDIQSTTVPTDETHTRIVRSVSAREQSTTKSSPGVGDLTRKQAHVDQDDSRSPHKPRDTKRRTVQLEYVAPVTQTQRGEPVSQNSPRGKTKARPSSQGPAPALSTGLDKPLPRDPPLSSHRARNSSARSSGRGKRASDSVVTTAAAGASTARPQTGGSAQSTGSRHVLGAGSRASYGQPTPPAVAGTNAHGKMTQPKTGSTNYVISNPVSRDTREPDFERSPVGFPPKLALFPGVNVDRSQASESADPKGHRRATTLGDISGRIFGRSGSMFRKRRAEQAVDKGGKNYPPVSMANAGAHAEGAFRPSVDTRASRRSFTHTLGFGGLGKKRSGSVSGSQVSQEKTPTSNKRFSFLRAVGLSRDLDSPGPSENSLPDLPIQQPSPVDETRRHNPGQRVVGDTNSPAYLQQGAMLQSPSDTSVEGAHGRDRILSSDIGQGDRLGRVSLQKNKRFDAFDGDDRGRGHDHAGSSGPAKRVMDFFRRRGKARGGEI